MNSESKNELEIETTYWAESDLVARLTGAPTGLRAWLKMARPGGPTQLTRDRRRPDARAMVKRFDGDLGGPT
jgi:hypothetical protein